MKTTGLFLIAFFLMTNLYAQEQRIIISGGYAMSNIEDTEIDGTGWRVNGVYEYNPMEGKVAHGLSIGYISISATDVTGVVEASYDIVSWPVYYAPKFLFGKEKFKGFLKGALGWQFSSIERTGTLVGIEDNDSGFTGGGGIGGQYSLNEKIFLNAEYELLWMSNSYYRDGLMNTASLGLGFKF